MTTGFVKHIIETHDGHDFFPYADFIGEHGRKPTPGEIIDLVDSAVYVFDPADYDTTLPSNRAKLATLTLVINKYKTDEAYRARAQQEAVEYVLDVDWSDLLNEEANQ